MLVTVFGKPSSGKSTLITNLAYKLAGNNYKVSLFSTDLTYASLQLYYNLPDPATGKSLVVLFQNEDFSNLDKYFIQTKDYKNIYVAGMDIDEKSSKYFFLHPDTVKKFLKRVRDMFDYVIVETTEDHNNPLSILSIAQADLLINTIYPDIQGVSYSFSHNFLINDIKPKAKIIRVACNVTDYMDLNSVSEVLGFDFDYVFPHNRYISRTMNLCLPIFYNLAGKQNKSFIAEVNNLYSRVVGVEKSHAKI